jgi:trimethylamine--corrinoid protein Co-methyltransferase
VSDRRFALNIPRMRVLSDEQCRTIHRSTLTVLGRTGVEVREPSAVDLFESAGCAVDGSRVRIPAELVERALESTPSCVQIHDRRGETAMLLEDSKVYFGTGSDTPNVVDPFTGERRPCVLDDIVRVSRVVDALDNLSFAMCSGIASDVHPDISDIHHFEALANNTTKPIVFTAWSLENLKTIVAMAEIVAGGAAELAKRPFLILYTEPISPLVFPVDSAKKLMYMASKSLPVVFAPSVTTGATGPVTLAGGLVQGNAEILAGFVLANVVNPGTPLIYGGSGEPLDMSTSLMCYAAPESMMMVAAYTDMARHYGFPLFGYAGCSDSPVYDQQASIESALWILLSTLSGGNLVHDVGYINNGLTTSFEQLVVSDEVIGLVRRVAGGIEVTEETLALDLIDRVGPGGEYLTSEHTLNHFRDNWFPKLISRRSFEEWDRNGRQELGARANQRVRSILEQHRPEALDEEISRELRQMVESAAQGVDTASG